MVDRLNVVLESRSGLGRKSEALLEAIVGNLAGRPGIDLVLVSPLAEINDDSTDQLTLLSIGSGAAVLTWTSPEQTMLDLGRIGFKGARSPHAGDPFTPHQGSTELPDAAVTPTPLAGPKVYAMDLRNLSAVDDLIVQLDRLRNVQSVKTFSIGSLATPPSPTRKPSVSTLTLSKRDTEPAGNSRLQPRRGADGLASKNHPQSSTGDTGLDDLIDQLDDFDV